MYCTEHQCCSTDTDEVDVNAAGTEHHCKMCYFALYVTMGLCPIYITGVPKLEKEVSMRILCFMEALTKVSRIHIANAVQIYCVV